MFAGRPSQDLITNTDCTVEVLTLDDFVVPLTVSDPPNGYLCSPSVAYLDYAQEETRHFVNKPVLRGGLSALITACTPLLRAARLDRQVQVNNWLFSTNLAPMTDQATALRLRDHLIATYPDRAVVMRSLNTHCDAPSLMQLRQAGFHLLPARQIYIDDRRENGQMTRDMRRDRRLLESTDYDVEPGQRFQDTDFDRAVELYQLLYRKRYSALNPDYTVRFLRAAQEAGVLQFTGLRSPTGQLDGIAGIFRAGQTMSVPILGLDTNLPLDAGLYRMLGTLEQNHAMAEKLIYNRSAGAAGYKRNRGAVPAVEYTAVYVDHLGPLPGIAVRIIGGILGRVGVPLMQRFAL